MFDRIFWDMSFCSSLSNTVNALPRNLFLTKAMKIWVEVWLLLLRQWGIPFLPFHCLMKNKDLFENSHLYFHPLFTRVKYIHYTYSSFKNNEEWMYLRTSLQANGPTDRWTDAIFYRDAQFHLTRLIPISPSSLTSILMSSAAAERCGPIPRTRSWSGAFDSAGAG